MPHPERGRTHGYSAPPNPNRFPISKNYLIEYPDGSHRHVPRSERDELSLAGLLKQTAATTYQYIGQQHTLHSFSELSILQVSATVETRRFLPGAFIVEFAGKRRRELLETPEACASEIRNGRYQSRAVGEFHPAGSDSTEGSN
jgi:hypothetical protein